MITCYKQHVQGVNHLKKMCNIFHDFHIDFFVHKVDFVILLFYFYLLDFRNIYIHFF